MAAAVGGVDEDDSMACNKHPFKNTSPSGGICAFCLQDKLGKLVSSSSSTSSSSSSFFPHSSSPPTSLRSDHHRLSALSTTTTTTTSSSSLLKRNKSTSHYSTSTTTATTTATASTPRRRGFWSFLHLPHKTPKPPPPPQPPQLPAVVLPTRDTSVQLVVVEEDTDSSPETNGTTSFERKVTRSRSVGCGSRSFSGDLLDRISTGLGDCALRRVESHREGGGGGGGGGGRIKHRHSTSNAMREKVRCGGLFGGFMMITSSSSSTSATSSVAHWAEGRPNVNGLVHGRTRSWGWAFASPRRAAKRDGDTTTTTTTATTTTTTATTTMNGDGGNNNNSKRPDLSAIPSLLSVRS